MAKGPLDDQVNALVEQAARLADTPAASRHVERARLDQLALQLKVSIQQQITRAFEGGVDLGRGG